MEPEQDTMNTFTYRGYNGAVDVDPDAGILFGRVLDLDAVLTFEAEGVREAKQAFHDTVDDHLDWCAERGKQLEKPFSGTLYVRTTPDVHRAAVVAASRNNKSLNAWLAEVVDRAVKDEAMTFDPVAADTGVTDTVQTVRRALTDEAEHFSQRR